MSTTLGLEHSYARDLAGYYARVSPTKVKSPTLIRWNSALADLLGIDTAALTPTQLAAMFAGNVLPADADPIAMVYAGHQFGHFVPQLGDGRAILLGERVGRDGVRRDIQLKGAGQTPFSRRGDGRAALGPVLREYLISEAMHALGIPATRALAAVLTGDPVYRETVLPGAVLTRVAQSHIRVGTFQFFARRGDAAAMAQLADYVIARHYPDAARAPQRYLALLDAVMARQADLIARWMAVGFVHGVMNTDNMAVSGETIDFGPCAFMDRYDPQTLFSSIDEGGRYAYENQAPIAQWNLARFAETLLPLIDEDGERAVAVATERVVGFAALCEDRWLAIMRAKLGLRADDGTADADAQLVRDLLGWMHGVGADYTQTFRRLCDVAQGGDGAVLQTLVTEGTTPRADAQAALDAWLARWRQRCATDGRTAVEQATAMRQVNPAVIPRNHRVEHALQRAAQHGDLSAFDALERALATPYVDPPPGSDAADPPPQDFGPYRTFCGT